MLHISEWDEKRAHRYSGHSGNDTDIEFSYPNEEDKMTTLREALKGCPKSDGVEYSEKKKKVLALVPPGGCWVDLPEDIGKRIYGEIILFWWRTQRNGSPY